ncbi:DEAD/DEAH box helicase [Saccharopolyspora cebuensis]|uniref:DEAD/DEAH box helicase n=1 Tax=Saccharopolyspora cebuensis TaxID=418759 RepID=A0ABV4CH57_9PSEU
MPEPLPPAALPGRLQATFVPAEGALAWWGVDDVPAALRARGLPEGRAGTCALAAVVDDRVVPAEVPARLLDPDSALDADGDASVRAWRTAAGLARDRAGDDAFAALARTMPPAAHAVLDGDAIVAAPALLSRFREVLATRDALRDARLDVSLRPYQADGVAWLCSRDGGVLADDMGLGKTVQAICAFATRPGPHLVVCPTSLVGNWRRELARFAPDLPVHGYHGPRRALPDEPGVVLTSYGVLRSDTTALAARHWDIVVFDEAQQIKNPDARVAKAAARVTAATRIAMTGTPVENRLDELWSILRVTNPGLLGGRARFRQRFAVPIEQRGSATAAARLHQLVAPHLLRRTKAEVTAELPAKQHATVACTVTAEQTRLYREAVRDAFDTGFGSGRERRGKVLALVTALKQICNHPAQRLGDDGPLTGRSGKFDRAAEMLAEIAADDDRALVFTQYRAMGDLLVRHLGEVLGRPVPFLHGGLTGARRDRLVEEFQRDEHPVLVLSLRAAGFGLNLTRAGHVVHYDRWWNPAVEDQATDRAHRIGQHRALTVHTLVTGGTIEDHIARMHETKRALADVVSGDPATALAELSDDELHAVLDLGGDV